MGIAWNLWRVTFSAFVVLAFPRGIVAQDCNGNGTEDAADIRVGTSADCNANGVPDECDVAALRIGYAEPRRFPTTIGSSESPNTVIPGDFDGDADVDLAVLHTGPSSDQATSVVLLRNAGDGTFGPPERVLTGLWLTAMVAPDLDGDGDLDLVVSFHHPTDRVVRIFLNNGDGTFDTGIPILEGHQIWHLIAADLDGDGGDPDLVGTNYCVADQTCPQVLLNEGDLRFTVTSLPAVDSQSLDRRLTAADFDDDGLVDLLVNDEVHRSYWLFWNEGDGAFLEPEPVDLGTFSFRPVPGDLDGDGNVDLVLGGSLVFNDRGLFDPPLDLNLDAWVNAAADLDLDGDLDLLAQGDDAILLLLNDGAGAFDQVVEIPFDEALVFQGAADLDGDGDPDLLEVLSSRSEVSVRLRLDVDVPEHPDLNGNGVPDACETDCNRNAVPDSFDIASGTSLDCNGNGIPDACDVTTEPEFALPDLYLQGRSCERAEAADFDRDGDLDLAVSVLDNRWVTITAGNSITRYLAGTVVLLDNHGDGTFEEPFDFELGDVQPIELVAADLDGDGHVDLATLSNPTEEIIVLLNESEGEPVTSFPVGDVARQLLAVDVDGDGDLDLLSENGLTNRPEVYLLRNRGDATFDPFSTLSPIGDDIFAADVDGDGDPDLVAERHGSILLHRNDGSGDFPRSERIGSGRVLVAVDFDLDGDIDLAGEGSHRDDRQILWNDGTGAFTAEPFRSRQGWRFPAIVDLDGDGDLDLATSGLTVLRNDEPFAGWATRAITETDGSFDIVAGDWDGDGRIDLALPDSGRSRLSVFLNRTAPASSRDRNHDGVPDECVAATFVRGDCNADGAADLSDIVCALEGFFAGRETGCAAALDTNGDGELNVTDPVFLLEFFFAAGPPPVDPFPGCGPGLAEADERLGCVRPLHCP